MKKQHPFGHPPFTFQPRSPSNLKICKDKIAFLRLKYFFPRNYLDATVRHYEFSLFWLTLINSKQKKDSQKKKNLETLEALLPVFKASKQMRLFLLNFFTQTKKAKPKLHPFLWLRLALSAGLIDVCKQSVPARWASHTRPEWSDVQGALFASNAAFCFPFVANTFLLPARWQLCSFLVAM